MSNDFKIINKNRQILKDLLPLKKPLSLFIEPTNICNFRCTPCVHGSENTRNDLKPFSNFDFNLYKQLIDELASWEGGKLKTLRLAVLGEPMINSDFAEMVKIAKKYDVAERVDTFSNGSFLTSELSEKLIEYELDYIRFSIYSVINERHKKISQVAFDINKIHENIYNLRRLREKKGAKKPYILVKMFDAYTEENQIFFNMYKDIADEIGLENVHNATKYDENDLVMAYYGNKEMTEKSNKNYNESLNSHIACPRPFMSMTVNCIGDVLMCTNDPAKGTKIGNVNFNTLREIWEGETMFEFRKMLLENRKHENRICKNCDWFKLYPPEDNVDGFPIEKLRG